MRQVTSSSNWIKANQALADAVAGPDGQDATLLSKPFQSFKTLAEQTMEKRKVVIGIPDVSPSLPREVNSLRVS